MTINLSTALLVIAVCAVCLFVLGGRRPGAARGVRVSSSGPIGTLLMVVAIAMAAAIMGLRYAAEMRWPGG